MPALDRVTRVDQVGVEERVARFCTRSIKKDSKVHALKLALSMIDLTTLEGQDTPGKVTQLCRKAVHLHGATPGLPHVAAVCVYPTMVGVARRALAGHDIKVASVATAFPSGMAPLSIKLEETRIAVDEGADEIDMVIARGAFLQGEYQRVFDEIVAVKEACGAAHLKVILETGELGTLDRVRRASVLAIHAGARFHQDLHRQDPACRDDAGHARHAAGDPRSLSSDRPHGRHEARRRHREGEAGDPLPRHAARDAGRGLADAGLVPLRREQPRERPPDADREAAHRRLPVGRLLLQGLSMARPDTKLIFDTSWQYAPAPESTDHVRIDPQYGLFIGGEFVAPRKRRYFETINPATTKPLAQIAQADAGDVDRAVAAARRAWQRSWSKLQSAERGKYLYRIARALQERAREFAVIETLDGGKPIRESRDVDVPLAAAHFFYYAGWADKLDYAFPGRRARPLGVAGQIIPWNFPLLMAAWKIAPALACGNTVVLKPAETTPLTALKLAELIRDVGLPPGVVNIVTGAGDTGAALVDARGRRQDRVHRLDRGRPADPAQARRARRSTTRSSSAARRPTSSSRTPRSTRPSRASSTGSSSTRATSAARARGCWCRNRSPRK